MTNKYMELKNMKKAIQYCAFLFKNNTRERKRSGPHSTVFVHVTQFED